MAATDWYHPEPTVEHNTWLREQMKRVGIIDWSGTSTPANIPFVRDRDNRQELREEIIRLGTENEELRKRLINSELRSAGKQTAFNEKITRLLNEIGELQNRIKVLTGEITAPAIPGGRWSPTL